MLLILQPSYTCVVSYSPVPHLDLIPVRRYLIIENFIPPEEKNKIMNRLFLDCEEEQWKFQPLVPAGL